MAEAYKEVIHEDSLKVGGSTKAPDYCFRIGGTRKFFVETKKPSVDIKNDPSPALQLRRYGWNAKLQLSIVTDFEEMAVYDCSKRPLKNDKAHTARVLLFHYSEYEERWDEIKGIFTKEGIRRGSFDKYADSVVAKKGTAEVDRTLLKEIESWRDSLAQNIALRNKDLSQRELNFAVQMTMDRILFLRICEDRGMEVYGNLMQLQNGTNTYERLCQIFKTADDRYNSGLFHFRHEKDESESPDELSLGLNIDDKTLKGIIKDLYYPESPFEFSVLPADILGHVYEQFLGKVIRLTAGHRAVVEYKPEVKKAGGVYYTPTYIVDYIVKNTVGKLVEGKKPKDVDKIKILDPACGSGSFLIGAYQYLLNWYLEQYTKDDAKKYARGSFPKLYQSDHGWRLTAKERARILTNNIFGVDIDTQAVEVTKLSLLLKVLEGETQLSIFTKRVLPELGNNIKCGNSLIGSDYYDGQSTFFVEDEERRRINAFDWNIEFPDIIKGPVIASEVKQSHGFDAVIGNPPYVRQEMLSDLKPYFMDHYQVYHGVADLYVYFIEKGISLLKDQGLFSIIVSNKWMRANYGEPLRKWMKKQGIKEIVDFGDLPVFQKATTYPCILTVSKKISTTKLDAAKVNTLKFTDVAAYMEDNRFSVNISSLDDKGWSLETEDVQALLEKIKKAGIPLGEYVRGKIYRGILTGLNEAFVIDKEARDMLISEDSKSAEIIKPFLTGRDIRRYAPPRSEKFLIFTRRGIDIKKYPAIENHLLMYKERLMPKPIGWSGKEWRGRKSGTYKWFEIQDVIDYHNEFEKPKIIVPDMAVKGSFTLDLNGGLFTANTVYFLSSNERYLLGILNSSLMTFFYRNAFAVFRGGYLRFFKQYMECLPIHNIDGQETHRSINGLVDEILKLNNQREKTKIPSEQESIGRRTKAHDSQIDQLVYELYGLTDKEIQIVEGNK